MSQSGGIVGAIPARYASTRLPGKPLLPLAGKPMVQHVVERVARVPEIERVVVLTDDERIFEAVEAFGGEVEMTPEDCASGTDRIAWAAKNWSCRAVINVQGDEPLIDPDAVGRLARFLARSPDCEMATLAAPLPEGRLQDPNAVKVVYAAGDGTGHGTGDGRDENGGRALYFSRAPIPHARREGEFPPLLHVGIYGYRRDALLRLADLQPTPLERAESLEQLRALEHGISIHVLRLERVLAGGVDTAEDVAEVEAILRSQASPCETSSTHSATSPPDP